MPKTNRVYNLLVDLGAACPFAYNDDPLYRRLQLLLNQRLFLAVFVDQYVFLFAIVLFPQSFYAFTVIILCCICITDFLLQVYILHPAFQCNPNLRFSYTLNTADQMIDLFFHLLAKSFIIY